MPRKPSCSLKPTKATSSSSSPRGLISETPRDSYHSIRAGAPGKGVHLLGGAGSNLSPGSPERVNGTGKSPPRGVTLSPTLLGSLLLLLLLLLQGLLLLQLLLVSHSHFPERVVEARQGGVLVSSHAAGRHGLEALCGGESRSRTSGMGLRP